MVICVLVLFWHLADRWGRVERDGVHVPSCPIQRTAGRGAPSAPARRLQPGERGARRSEHERSAGVIAGQARASGYPRRRFEPLLGANGRGEAVA
jgi:hypothetical protein